MFLESDVCRQWVLNDAFRRLCFRNDPELRESVAVPFSPKNPRSYATGGFAIVFALQTPDGCKHAVRFFTREVEGLFERYRAITDAVRRLSHIPHFVRFTLQEQDASKKQGAFVNGKWYPYVKMEWVEGVGFKRYVGERCRDGDRNALRRLAEQWLSILLEMERAQVAHGDLQAGNILVDSRGNLRLIDYDTMYSPALRGRTAIAVGLPGYIHPKRQLSHFDLSVDRFPALMIYLTFRALAFNPSFYQFEENPSKIRAFGMPVGDEEILFGAGDFLNPDTSSAFRQLLVCGDAEIQRLTRALMDACKAPYENTPPLAKILDPEAPLRDALKRLETALQSGTERDVLQAWEDGRILGNYAPAKKYLAAVESAGKRVACMNVFLVAAGRSALDDELLRIWASEPAMSQSKLAGIPCPELGGTTPLEFFNATNLRVHQRNDAMEEIRQAVRSQDALEKRRGTLGETEEETIARLWEAHRTLLESHPPACQEFRDRAEVARKRLEKLDMLRNGLRTDDDALIAEAWGGGLVLSRFASAASFRERIQTAIARVRLTKRLEEHFREHPLDDEGLLRLWRSEPRMADATLSQRKSLNFGETSLVEQVAVAERRLGILERIRVALSRRPPDVRTVGNVWDTALCREHPAFAPLLPQIDAALLTMERFRRLEQAIERNDDKAICTIWSEELAGFDPSLRQRVAQALTRIRLGASALMAETDDVSLLAGNILQIRWRWHPDLPFCYVALRGDRYPRDPQDVAFRSHTLLITREQYERDSGVSLTFGGAAAYASVWPSMVFCGKPLMGDSPLYMTIYAQRPAANYSDERPFHGECTIIRHELTNSRGIRRRMSR